MKSIGWLGKAVFDMNLSLTECTSIVLPLMVKVFFIGEVSTKIFGL